MLMNYLLYIIMKETCAVLVVAAIYKQLEGRTRPEAVPAAWLQEDCAGRAFLYVSFTSSNLMLLHGYFELQLKFTATSVADVPWMSWYVTSLTLTPDTCETKFSLIINMLCFMIW